MVFAKGGQFSIMIPIFADVEAVFEDLGFISSSIRAKNEHNLCTVYFLILATHD